MGTSSSYGGPSDRTPLLPAWALPPAAPQPEEPPPPDEPPDDDGQADDETGQDDGPPPGTDTDTEPAADNPAENPRPAVMPPAVAPTGTWKSARIGFGKAVASRTPQSFRKAARAYARAARGSGSGAASARSGKRATAALGGFLSAATGQGGLQRALEGLGLGGVVGRDVNEVLAAISNALAPDGATKEEAAAREAVNEAIEGLYERFLSEGRDLSALETMGPADIAASVAACVEAYVYNRWLGDLGVRIEQKAVSAAEAVRIERDVRAFIHETVRLDMSRVDVMTLDWRGEPGRLFVETIYRDAYALFGGEE